MASRGVSCVRVRTWRMRRWGPASCCKSSGPLGVDMPAQRHIPLVVGDLNFRYSLRIMAKDCMLHAAPPVAWGVVVVFVAGAAMGGSCAPHPPQTTRQRNVLRQIGKHAWLYGMAKMARTSCRRHAGPLQAAATATAVAAEEG